MRRLVALDADDRLTTTEDARLVAVGLGVSLRTVWRLGRDDPRWRRSGRAGRVSHFVVTEQMRQRLAFWRGNVAALHRELVEQAGATGEVPSRQTLQRAV